MDRMWSPWRSRHLTDFEQEHQPDGGASDGDASVFSRIAAEPDRDDEHLVLWRGEGVFALMNLYPYNNGHLLVVPYREVSDYEDLTPAERHELADTVGRCVRWLRAALSPDGFNVGMNLGEAAGAGIPRHLHAHVVPRWSGDTNFMPTVAEVKLIPEAMRETYLKLRRAVEASLEDGG